MSAEFEVTITDKDMFRFNIYHAYHGFQGIIATLVGIWVLVMAGLTLGKVNIHGFIYRVWNPFSGVCAGESLFALQKAVILFGCP